MTNLIVMLCIGMAIAFVTSSFFIRLVVIVGAALVLAHAAHAMTFQRAKALFSHLENTSGYHVQLLLDPDPDFNAWTNSPYSITITQGLLDFCNDAQIISVMGHELGHIDHQDYRKDNSSYDQEMKADLNGDYYCRKMGYSKKQCISFMYKARKTDGEDEGDGEHPGWTQRIRNVHKHGG